MLTALTNFLFMTEIFYPQQWKHTVSLMPTYLCSHLYEALSIINDDSIVTEVFWRADISCPTADHSLCWWSSIWFQTTQKRVALNIDRCWLSSTRNSCSTTTTTAWLCRWGWVDTTEGRMGVLPPVWASVWRRSWLVEWAKAVVRNRSTAYWVDKSRLVLLSINIQAGDVWRQSRCGGGASFLTLLRQRAITLLQSWRNKGWSNQDCCYVKWRHFGSVDINNMWHKWCKYLPIKTYLSTHLHVQ